MNAKPFRSDVVVFIEGFPMGLKRKYWRVVGGVDVSEPPYSVRTQTPHIEQFHFKYMIIRLSLCMPFIRHISCIDFSVYICYCGSSLCKVWMFACAYFIKSVVLFISIEQICINENHFHHWVDCDGGDTASESFVVHQTNQRVASNQRVPHTKSTQSAKFSSFFRRAHI